MVLCKRESNTIVVTLLIISIIYQIYFYNLVFENKKIKKGYKVIKNN